MIIDCAVYEDGRRRPGVLELDHALEACRANDAFVWIGLYEPDQAEFDAVAREFEIHELAVEDVIEAHQRPKLEVYDDMLLLVLKTVRYVDHEEVVEVGEIIILCAEDFLVTVRHGDASPLHDVRERLEARPHLLRHGPAAALYAIVDRVVDDYEPAAAGLDLDVQQVEQEVFSGERSLNPAERIFKLEREVLEFSRAAAPLLVPLDRLARDHFPHLVCDDLHEYFRDVHDHLTRVVGHLDADRQLLTSILQAHLAQVTIHQNEDVRRISAWAAILAVPTAIAGVYGMNFEQMPELTWDFGYPLALGLMITICSLLHWRLRRAGWL